MKKCLSFCNVRNETKRIALEYHKLPIESFKGISQFGGEHLLRASKVYSRVRKFKFVAKFSFATSTLKRKAKDGVRAHFIFLSRVSLISGHRRAAPLTHPPTRGNFIQFTRRGEFFGRCRNRCVETKA